MKLTNKIKTQLKQKKDYTKPVVSKLGDISSHTLGAYVGTNDAGNNANAKF